MRLHAIEHLAVGRYAKPILQLKTLRNPGGHGEELDEQLKRSR